MKIKIDGTKDKVQHMLVNMLGVFAGSTAGMLVTDESHALCTAIALCIGLSLGKEYGDKRATGNHWCWWDLAADGLGIIIGAVLFCTLYRVAQLVIMKVIIA